jgi:hypothetical protein
VHYQGVVYPEPLEAETDAAQDHDQGKTKSRDGLSSRASDHRQKQREREEQVSQDACMDSRADEDKRRVSPG